MELRAPTEPIDDPFFAAVRRRHPEVDVVLLPAAGPPDESAPDPTPPDEVDAALTQVAAQAERLWGTVAPGAGERPEARFRFGDGPASVRAVARVSARRDDGFEVLVRLRHELERHGWAVRRPRGVGVERLTGVLDEVDLTASYAEETGALLVMVGSRSMPVGAERARELTSRGAEG